jgi:hypothetical protein
MSTDAISLNSTTVTDVYPSPTDMENSSASLPRSGWHSQVSYLRAIFRAKKALDRIEQEAGIVRNYK